MKFHQIPKILLSCLYLLFVHNSLILAVETGVYELNNSIKDAYFIGKQSTITAKFESENDVDFYKIIVTKAGVLKIVFTPEGAHSYNPIFYVNLLDYKGEKITGKNSVSGGPYVFEFSRTIDKGVYYLECGFRYDFDRFDDTSFYTVNIVPLSGLQLSDTQCSDENLNGCTTDTECVSNNGYWYDNRCNESPCNAKFLSLCPDAESCLSNGGYWSTKKEFCVNIDILDLELQVDTIKSEAHQEGYEEGIEFCKASPEECGIEIQKQNCEKITSEEQETKEDVVFQDSCASYNMFTNTLHIPCLSIGTESYWIDMMLEGTEPIKFELKDFGRN